MVLAINNPIILVDGSCYVHRAYHAFPPFTTSNGEPVWVIYGVLSMIRKLLIRYQPTHMAIVFDAIGKTFRDDLFSKYKSNRIATPKELYIQIDPLCEIITAMGLPILSIPFVEADDVIGTLAEFYAQSGKTVLISTGDKDMGQIVSSQITLINTMSNIIFNPEEIEKKFGVPPMLIIDYLALTGDRSDNIPGVPGIGKKTAQILLNNIGNLRVLYNNLDEIYILGFRRATKIKNTLQINKEIAFLSYKLATIKTDVPLNKEEYQLLIKQANINTLSSLFKKYEFKNWLMDLQSGKWLNKYRNFYKQPSKQWLYDTSSCQIKKLSFDCINEKKNIDIIYNIDTLYYWIKKIYTDQIFVFNIQTNTTNVFTATVISVCLSTCQEETAYLPIKNSIINNDTINPDLLSLKVILLALQPILEDPKIKKIIHNSKFSYAFLKQNNINLSGMVFDVMLEFYILYGTSNYQNIKNFLDKNTLDTFVYFKKAYENYSNNIVLDIQNIQLQSLYSAQLINSMLNLHHILWSKIQENNKLQKIFEEIEMPLISVLSRIESYGVLIDKNLLNAHAIELDYRLNTLEMAAHKLADTSFNLDSTKQLQEILYNKQKLPILKKTPHGAPSTNEEVLKKLAKKYPMPKIILQYRGLAKLKCTYTNKLINMINKQSNRVHTSYNQTRTSTGRLSSTHPNLQNIPNRNHDGRKIRQAFIAPKNFLIVAADYSQIELRIMAHLSHDTKLVNDFLSEKDIHAATAAEIFVTALNLVTNEQRHLAKTINFGLIYGMSAFGLARQLSVTCTEAQKYVDRYFKRYPRIMEYMQHIRNNVNKHGYVSTLDGRKLYLPDIYSPNLFQKKSAERAAINAPMQGSAADIIKRAMISIDNWLQNDSIPVHMIMQVHDELVFEVQNNVVDIAVKKIKKLMEECYILDVPLKVDIGVGKNWEQAH